MSLVANCLVVVFEIIGLYISISKRHWSVFVYYTQISNMITLVSSVCLIAFGSCWFTAMLRYLSTCMLTMTFIITLFVLVPMGGEFRKLMLSGNGLYHHTLCPVISVTSYILWEQHNTVMLLPIIITFVYGIIMLLLNYLRKYDGPYPFFKVYEQSKRATVLWTIALVAIISVISYVISLVA